MPAKKTTKKVAASPASKDKGATAPKAPTKAPAKKAAVRKTVAKAVTPAAPAPKTRAEIAKAAYLNYRRRIELGLPGDEVSDWHQAEREG